MSPTKPLDGWRPPEFGDDFVIRVLVANPKKPGTAAWHRFNLYRDKMTIRQALDAGLWRADFRFDVARGFIVIAVPRPRRAAKAAKATEAAA